MRFSSISHQLRVNKGSSYSDLNVLVIKNNIPLGEVSNLPPYLRLRVTPSYQDNLPWVLSISVTSEVNILTNSLSSQ